jgi:peptidyl-prolyl cis-trans isomerase D
VLQDMRSAGKYIMWVLLAAFIGGYLLVDTSGLLGVTPVTQGTAIAKVNGTEIPYVSWLNATNGLVAEQESQQGRSLDLDERAQLEQQAFDELVLQVLLEEEYKRRGIKVLDEEIVEAARFSPPPAVQQNPDLQTDGRFDPEKWQRFLASPIARQQGTLAQLESYYRAEIPRVKLYQQIAGEAFVSDWRLWQVYADQTDSATVSYVSFRAAAGADSLELSKVTDAEISAYYNQNRRRLTTATRGTVSALVIPRTPTAEDTAATREQLLAIRARIVAGESFEAVAREVSDDSVSGADGGSLGSGGRNRFVAPFETALYALRPGQLSEPVLTQFGWHLIKMDARTGDSVTSRHILLRVRQTEERASASDRLADQAARIAANATDPTKLDSAAAAVGIPLVTLNLIEGRRGISTNGTVLPGLTQWATSSGAAVGEVSDLLDGDEAYFVARLDSVVRGGEQPLSAVKEDIRKYLASKKAIEALVPSARQFAASAASASLESAATTAGLEIQRAGPFSRTQFVQGLGQLSPMVGAAHSIAVGAVSQPIVGEDGVYVIRVDERKQASREVFNSQLPQQRATFTERLQQERVRQYLTALRDAAKVDDLRAKVLGNLRQQAVTAQ